MAHGDPINIDINSSGASHSCDETPYAFTEPQELNSYYADTAYINNRPAAAYYDDSNPNIEYAESKYKRLAYKPIIGSVDMLASRVNDFVYSTRPIDKDDTLITKTPESLIERQSHQHEIEYFHSRYNKAGKFYFLAGMGYMFSTYLMFLPILGALGAFFIGGGPFTWSSFGQSIEIIPVWYIIGFTLWKGGAYFASKLPDNKFRAMNRRTGMVTFPQKGKLPNIEIPFSEFEPRIKLKAGSFDYHRTLVYVHKSGSPIFSTGERFLADVYFRAAYLEQFMNINRPLPDLPHLEWCRHKDPVTAAYDKKHNRDPYFWRNKSFAEIQEMGKQRRIKLIEILGSNAFTT